MAANSWDQDCIDALTDRVTGAPPAAAPASTATICDFAVSNGNGAANMNGLDIRGDIYSDGDVNGYNYIYGDAYSMLNINHSGMSGSKYASLSSAPYTKPGWNDVVPDPTCASTTTANESWTSGPAAGSFGNVFVDANIQLPDTGGALAEYYMNSFQLTDYSSGSGYTLTLPADGSPVNFYVCGGNFNLQNGTSIVSPTGDATQLAVFVNGSNITFNNGSSADGMFANVAGSSSITVSANVDIDGLLHNVTGTVTAAHNGSVDATGIDRDTCLDRFDPHNSPPNYCPVGDSPAVPTFIDEPGTCESNVDAMGTLSSTTCMDTDLTLDAPCDDQIPVCNRGLGGLSAGQAEIVFFPRSTIQFGTTTPDPFYQEATKCDVNVPVPAGSCVDVTCPTFMEDMTARVQFKTAATESECNDLDNWTHYPEDRECGSPMSTPTVKVVTENYQAVCPANYAVSWGYLAWNTSLEGAATVDFAVRTSEDGSFMGAYTHLATAETASSTADCGWADCGIRLTDTLFPTLTGTQPEYLELEITLTPDGGDVATLEEWEVRYSCIADQ
jgi:hypothetical protein